jgi:hypothetical protein
VAQAGFSVSAASISGRASYKCPLVIRGNRERDGVGRWWLRGQGFESLKSRELYRPLLTCQRARFHATLKYVRIELIRSSGLNLILGKVVFNELKIAVHSGL